ncbi:hypothetical protein LX77_03363 [Gelidibacter algens]|uniref:Uncharacterized protein n=1 Tax=Gelidibacter algens TaxID=49280 RepID=A0A1A7R2I9_9FLAO|nr:hypothetical protein [Gelidibacter algens]OBX24992.1 hypothetical protein A9996_12400 [Gelidibacter algens]RAJ19842.1 hypothetical protein LX77_03363 [Gelidibacter algens]
MRKLIYIVILGCLLSCNQEAQKILTELPNEIENVQESNEPTEGEKVAIRLSEIAPLSEEALRKAFPKQLKALPVDEDIMVIGQQVIGGFGDRTITLSIVDAAGPNNQIAAQLIDSYAFDKPQETENFKIVNQERDGIETHAEYYKYSGKSEMSFLFNKRFYISLSNNDNRVKLNPDELWEAFDISVLEPYKEY